MGLQIILEEAMTDTTIPIVQPHPAMMPTSIMCLDFPYENLSAVPASGATLYNYAGQNIVSLTASSGSPITTGLDAVYNISNPIIPAEMVLGIASNGAFQGIYTKSADTGATACAAVDFGNAVKAYLIANSTNQYYVFDILKKLYDWHNASTADLLIGSSATYSSNQLCHAGTSDYGYVAYGTGRLLGSSQTTINGILFRDCAVNGAFGNINLSTLYRGFWKACGGNGPFGGSEVNKGVSNALFNAGIIDMTAGGLTYAQCHALILSYFTIEANPGGRFYGGTYLDPTTLP